MTKSELIARLAERYPQLVAKDAELAVNTILDAMSSALTEGDRIEIDIPNRSINLAISDDEFAKRRAAMIAKGDKAWKPVEVRTRKVSKALRAYASMATSADKGAVRKVD